MEFYLSLAVPDDSVFKVLAVTGSQDLVGHFGEDFLRDAEKLLKPFGFQTRALPVPHKKNDLAGSSGIIFPELLFDLAVTHVTVVELQTIMQNDGIRGSFKRNIERASFMQKFPDDISQTDVMTEKEGRQGFGRKRVGILAVLVPDAFQTEGPVFLPEHFRQL